MHTYEKILQAISEASMCWFGNPASVFVFDAERAVEIAKRLYMEIIGKDEETKL